MENRLREMFLGTFYHTLETNRRVTLPKAFRDESANWIISRGFDGGLLLFPESQFAEELKRLETSAISKKDNRDLLRLLTNEATLVAPDSLGRIQLPEYLTKFAGLNENIVITGSLHYVEIWDRDLYHQYLERIEPTVQEIAERIHDHE